MKIAVLDDYQNVARDMADWSGLERKHEITFFHDIHEGLNGFAKRLEPFEILCIMRERSPIGRDLIERLPNARLFVTAGMRNAAIDLDACKERGIPVLGTGGSAQSTPELAWGLMLSLARNIHIENARMREGKWITTLGTDMQGKTLGILGLGRLGTKMAQIARAFDMKVIAWSQNLTDAAATEAGASDASAFPISSARSTSISAGRRVSDLWTWTDCTGLPTVRSRIISTSTAQ